MIVCQTIQKSNFKTKRKKLQSTCPSSDKKHQISYFKTKEKFGVISVASSLTTISNQTLIEIDYLTKRRLLSLG